MGIFTFKKNKKPVKKVAKKPAARKPKVVKEVEPVEVFEQPSGMIENVDPLTTGQHMPDVEKIKENSTFQMAPQAQPSVGVDKTQTYVPQTFPASRTRNASREAQAKVAKGRRE